MDVQVIMVAVRSFASWFPIAMEMEPGCSVVAPQALLLMRITVPVIFVSQQPLHALMYMYVVYMYGAVYCVTLVYMFICILHSS